MFCEPLASAAPDGAEFLLRSHFGGGARRARTTHTCSGPSPFPARFWTTFVRGLGSRQTLIRALRRHARGAATGAPNDLAADRARPRARATLRRDHPGQ